MFFGKRAGKFPKFERLLTRLLAVTEAGRDRLRFRNDTP